MKVSIDLPVLIAHSYTGGYRTPRVGESYLDENNSVSVATSDYKIRAHIVVENNNRRELANCYRCEHYSEETDFVYAWCKHLNKMLLYVKECHKWDSNEEAV